MTKAQFLEKLHKYELQAVNYRYIIKKDSQAESEIKLVPRKINPFGFGNSFIPIIKLHFTESYYRTSVMAEFRPINFVRVFLIFGIIPIILFPLGLFLKYDYITSGNLMLLIPLPAGIAFYALLSYINTFTLKKLAAGLREILNLSEEIEIKN